MRAGVHHTGGLERYGGGGGGRGFGGRSGQIGRDVLVSSAIDKSGSEVALDQPILVGPLARDRNRRRRPAEL